MRDATGGQRGVAVDTSSGPRQTRTRGPVITALVVVLGVGVAALVIRGIDAAVPLSASREPLSWVTSSVVAVAAQAVLWSRAPRALIPIGLVLLGLALYAMDPLTEIAFMADTPVVWITGTACLATGLVAVFASRNPDQPPM